MDRKRKSNDLDKRIQGQQRSLALDIMCNDNFESVQQCRKWGARRNQKLRQWKVSSVNSERVKTTDVFVRFGQGSRVLPKANRGRTVAWLIRGSSKRGDHCQCKRAHKRVTEIWREWKTREGRDKVTTCVLQVHASKALNVNLCRIKMQLSSATFKRFESKQRKSEWLKSRCDGKANGKRC
jgi:hypothetical protein